MDEKAHNPGAEKAARLLISFVADNSASMKSDRLRTLMGAFRQFAQKVADQSNLEWELLTFDTFSPAVVKSFESGELLPVSAGRFPLLGRAALTAADRLSARVKALRDAGETVYRPWMFLLSDGFTMDNMDEAAARLDRMEQSGELLYLPFKLSPKLATERLQILDRNKHMIEIKEGQIESLFSFVLRMIEQRATLAPDVGIKFAKSDFEGWAVL